MTDADGDGTGDQQEGVGDADSDGIPNYLDPDDGGPHKPLPPLQVDCGQMMSSTFCPHDAQTGISMKPSKSRSTQSRVIGSSKLMTV